MLPNRMFTPFEQSPLFDESFRPYLTSNSQSTAAAMDEGKASAPNTHANVGRLLLARDAYVGNFQQPAEVKTVIDLAQDDEDPVVPTKPMDGNDFIQKRITHQDRMNFIRTGNCKLQNGKLKIFLGPQVFYAFKPDDAEQQLYKNRLAKNIRLAKSVDKATAQEPNTSARMSY